MRSVGAVGAVEGVDAAARLLQIVSGLEPLPIILMMVTVGSFFAILGFKGGTAATPDSRRRLVLLYTGAAVGLTPTALLIVGSLIAGRPDAISSDWVVLPALLSMLDLPAQPRLRHRRPSRDGRARGRAAGAAVRAGPARDLGVADRLAIVIAIVAASTLSGERGIRTRPRRMQYARGRDHLRARHQRAADRLRGWIDRRFFREAYDAEQILTALSEGPDDRRDRHRCSTTVGQRIAESLHVPRIGRALRARTARYVVRLSRSGIERRRACGFPRTARPCRAPARVARSTLLVHLDDPASWVSREAGPRSAPPLDALRPELLLPLARQGQAARHPEPGPQAVGGAVFRRPTSVCCDSVAAQTALALENSRLTAAMARRECARARRMNREIEIAREVQERLFPQDYPPVPGLDYAGYCRPALGVGGDYYDFMQVGDAARASRSATSRARASRPRC